MNCEMGRLVVSLAPAGGCTPVAALAWAPRQHVRDLMVGLE